MIRRGWAIRSIVVVPALLGAALDAGPSPARAADPGPAAVAAALDSLDGAAVLARNAQFVGSRTGLEQAAAIRDRQIVALDAAAREHPAWILDQPWPVRVAWLNRALYERRTDWLALVDSLSGGDALPPAGSGTRGDAALSVGLAFDALARDAADAGSPAEARRLQERAALAYRAAAAEDFLLRDEAFHRLWRAAGDSADSLAPLPWADSLALRVPRSLRTPPTRITRVKARLAAGDPTGALEEMTLALPAGDSARLRWLGAQAYLALDRPRDAATELEGIVSRYGWTRQAWDAYHLRLDLGFRVPELVLTKQDRAELVQFLLAGPQRSAAQDSLRAFAAPANTPRLRHRALELLAGDAFSRKEYDAALLWLEELIRDAEPATARQAELTRARILRNTGRRVPMEAQYREIVRMAGPQASTAIWELGRELESLGAWAEAESAYAGLLRDFPTHGKRDEARFRLGFARYQQGRTEAAAETFRALYGSVSGSDEERAAFWLARCLEDLARPEEAASLGAAAAASTAPAGSYGVSLRLRYGSTRPEPDGASHPWGALETPEDIVSAANWPNVLVWHFRRGAALAERGELTQAGAEWRRVAELRSTEAGVDRALALAAATYDVYPGGVTWARAASLEFGADDLRRAGYDRLGQPMAYYDDVIAAARAHGAHPDLVWSVMRQESLYDPLAVSVAGARGLLQLMPATLQRIVRERGLPPMTAEALFRPDVNIELGTRFLMDRLGEFDEALMPALASYNAGEGKVREWIELAKGETDERFLECIGYPETYTYVRRVIWLAWIYRNRYPQDGGPAIPDTGTR